ncbi:Ig-like domain-containing protein [Massilia sp. TSP1-1-2]|uniref:Ig-like domain-containing protein n=1 Tax=Massilia sp. TSP1-1-2 TaxID=2804649 RepID=UPI003CE9471C
MTAHAQTCVHGVLSRNAGGTLKYTPALHFYGVDSFEYSYEVEGQVSNLATVHVTVSEVIYAPVSGGNVNAQAIGGVPFTFDPLAGAQDINGHAMSAVLDTPPAHGALVVNANGSWTYTANADYDGADVLVFHINDGLADSAPVSVSFQVTPENRAPTVVHNAAIEVLEDGSLVIDFGSFGADADGDALSAVITSQPSRGVLAQNANGTWTYTPGLHFYGSDTLSFILSDGFLSSQEASLGITIAKVQIAPTLVDSDYALDENGSLTLSPFAAANSVNREPLTALVVSQPAHGQITVNADGSWSYTPALYFFGTDSFSYKVNDGIDDSNTATVVLNVAEIAFAPTLGDSIVNLDENGSARFEPLATAFDRNGDVLSAVLLTQPAHGLITVNADGSWTYTPELFYFGSDSFTYKVSDAAADSNMATVTLNVAEIAFAPTLGDVSIHLSENAAASFNPLASAADLNHDVLNAVLVSMPSHGVLTVNADGSWTYTPALYYFGSDSFTFKVSDGNAYSNTATVVLNVAEIAFAPTLANSALSLDENASASFNPLAHALDLNPNDVLAALVVSQPAHGAISVNADGSWTYTPAQYYFGTDSFTYKVNDGVADSNTATVTFTVGEIAFAPTLADSTVNVSENGTSTFNPLAAAADRNANDVLTASVVRQPAHGSWTYTPALNYYGPDSLTYQISDGVQPSNVATLTFDVAKVNYVPVLAGSTATVNEGASVVITPLAHATDVNLDALAAIVVTQPAHGAIAVNANGTWTYTPQAGYFGADRFTYKVNDGVYDSNLATVSLTVVQTNHAPVAVNGSASVNRDTSVVLNLLAGAVDTDGDSLTVKLVAAPAHGALAANANGTFTYTPVAGYVGNDSFSYKVSDGKLDSALVTFSLSVLQVNRAPVALNSLVAGTEDTAVLLRWSDFAVSDADNDVLTLAITALPADGVLQKLASTGSWVSAALGDKFVAADLAAGKLRYVPAANASDGAGYATAGYGNQRAHYARFSYTVSDGILTSAAATVSIDIAAVADAPAMQVLGSTLVHRMFATGWEGAANIDSQSTLVAGSVFDGWSLVTTGDQLSGGQNGFEIWSNGDMMTDVNGTARSVRAATGNGNNWLELNDASSTQAQTLGISRQVNTDKGASYNLSFDLAGRLGYVSDYTRVGVYVDGVRVALYDNTSGTTALNWQHANISFIGNGSRQTIKIITEASRRDTAGRGMMLDNISLVESLELNHGVQGGSVQLQAVQATLADADGSEALQLSVAGLSVGSVLTDGVRTVTVTAAQPVVDITGWNANTLSLTPPATYRGALALQVTATSTEAANGSKASVSRTLNVQVDAVAQAPVLTLTPPTGKLSRTIVSTDWGSGYCDSSWDTGPDLLAWSQLSGWNIQAASYGKTAAFPIWEDGDRMTNTLGTRVTVYGPVAGSSSDEWLALNNGVNAS